jgi:hypothetical protein
MLPSAGFKCSATIVLYRSRVRGRTAGEATGSIHLSSKADVGTYGGGEIAAVPLEVHVCLVYPHLARGEVHVGIGTGQLVLLDAQLWLAPSARLVRLASLTLLGAKPTTTTGALPWSSPQTWAFDPG